MKSSVSVVVVAHDMARELPRTLRTLSASYQQGISPSDYEVIVVDNGSPTPFEPSAAPSDVANIRWVRIDDAPASPARAANVGIELATGDLVGLIVDGARMASPGLLATARRGASLFAKPIVATIGYHLGPSLHMDAADTGYDQETEDALLASSGWDEDGYQLFSISTLAGSSTWGWFEPLAESSAVFMPRDLWAEVGGLDERFELPGGGFVNHDLYRRACELKGSRLVVLLGEGTFHQMHGGAATSGRHRIDQMRDDYERLRGAPYRVTRKEPFYFGRVPDAALDHLVDSAAKAVERRRTRKGS